MCERRNGRCSLCNTAPRYAVMRGARVPLLLWSLRLLLSCCCRCFCSSFCCFAFWSSAAVLCRYLPPCSQNLWVCTKRSISNTAGGSARRREGGVRMMNPIENISLVALGACDVFSAKRHDRDGRTFWVCLVAFAVRIAVVLGCCAFLFSCLFFSSRHTRLVSCCLLSVRVHFHFAFVRCLF